MRCSGCGFDSGKFEAIGDGLFGLSQNHTTIFTSETRYEELRVDGADLFSREVYDTNDLAPNQILVIVAFGYLST